MKKISLYILAASLILFVGSCVKNEDPIFTGALVELDAASWNANSVGLTYPILNRVPPAGRAVTTACPDSTLRRFSGTIRLRINVVGPQSNKDETVGFKMFGVPITTVTFPATLANTTANQNAITGLTCPQTPATAAGTVFASDAVAGVHYNIPAGNKITIPANSSFGFIDIQILNPGSTAGSARFLGIELDETGSIKPNPNYNKVGLLIDQR